MMDNGAQSVLSVVNDVKKQRLIPFVKTFIIDVNLSDPMAKRIIVDWQSDW
jgi:ribosomal 30S subunit maturation factor RimM